MHTLIIKHTNIIGNSKETNRFEYDYTVTFLRGSTLHFINSNAPHFVYQVEIGNINLQLSPRLQKASEFIRRTCYAYNQIELRIDSDSGEIFGIRNREELINRWQRLRNKLANEYEGDSVHLYLKEIDEEMNINKAVWEAIYCYQNFGLLFPHISQNQYNNNWKNRRKIKLSPYEDELFEECTTYIPEFTPYFIHYQ
jgi:hypothetical protein